MEDLRQLCIWKNAADKWWDYAIYYGAQCRLVKDQATCVNNGYQAAGFDDSTISQINDCITNSFRKKSGKPLDIYLDDNQLLAQERDKQVEQGIQHIPSLAINYVLYDVSCFIP